MEPTPVQIETPKASVWPHSRLHAFTDSVFAFAVTLLILNIIDLHIPTGDQSLVPTLKHNMATFVTFIATFIIIARFWMSHTRLFSAVRELDRTIVNLNMVLLFFITIFPFVASVLGTHMGNPDAVALYAACFAVIGVIEYLIGRHAFKRSLLVQEDLNPRFLFIFTVFSLTTPVVFVISIALAYISPYLAEGLWMLLLFIRSGFRFYYRNNTAAEKDVENM